MANYRLKTNINKGVFKGLKVEDLVKTDAGKKYLLLLHNSKKYNVKLTNEVMSCLEL